MASSHCEAILSQCIGIVRELSRSDKCASISVRIGQDFDFSFSNQDIISTKRMSPSKQNRNKTRKIKYEQGKATKLEEVQEEVSFKQEFQSSSSQTDVYGGANDIETQTEFVTSKDIAISTEAEVFEKLDSGLNVDKNGVIQPQDASESLIEMRIGHNFKTWEEIKHYVEESLGMSLIGRPWLANSGNLYKTVGFRTKTENYEEWKIRTFNWQESGVRVVVSSRLYR